jgi:hypothetical protein
MQMMSYDEAYVPRGLGFVNYSAMCYLNSLLQSLLSLPSLFKTLSKLDEIQNPLASKLLTLHKTAMNGGDISHLNESIFDELYRISPVSYTHLRAHET